MIGCGGKFGTAGSVAETTLKLIETVDAGDTAKLDEIDARVWCWINGAIFERAFRNNIDSLCVKNTLTNVAAAIPEYTRSRDALKAIRPQGYVLVF